MVRGKKEKRIHGTWTMATLTTATHEPSTKQYKKIVFVYFCPHVARLPSPIRTFISRPKSVRTSFSFFGLFSSRSNHTHSNIGISIYSSVVFAFSFLCVLFFLCLWLHPHHSHCANGVRMYDSFHSSAVTMRHLRLPFHRSVPINKIFDGIHHTTHARTLALTRTQAGHKMGQGTIWTYAASPLSSSSFIVFPPYISHLGRNERRKLFLCKFVGYSLKTAWIWGWPSRESNKKVYFSYTSLARLQWELNACASTSRVCQSEKADFDFPFFFFFSNPWPYQ